MSKAVERNLFHDITICQDHTSGVGTRVFLGGTELHGVRSVDYSVSVNEVPTVDLSIIPERCNINILADLGLSVDIDSLTTAIKCIQFEMMLNSDFKDSVRASVLSALSEIDFTETTLSKAADRIIDRIFFGER